MGIQMKSIRQYIPESLKKINAYVIITNGNILTEYFCQHISSGNFFLSAYFPSIKPLVFFLLTELVTDVGITDGCIPSVK
jgi:hypothetical protein